MLTRRSTSCYARSATVRAQTARAWPVVLLVVLAVGGIGAATLLALRDRGNAQTGDPARAATDPDGQMQELQNQFKIYSENRQDFNNLLPEVQAFTLQYPERADGHLLLGQVMMKLERWERALGPLSRALEINPDFPQLQKLAGQCAAKLGLWAQAEAHLERALAMRADREVHMMLGSVYFQTDRADQAQAQYMLAIEKGRATPPHQAYSGLADVYGVRGDWARALSQVDQAIQWGTADDEVDPATYPLQKVRLLLDAGRTDDAGALLKVVAQDYPRATATLPFARIQARLWAERGQRQSIPGLYALIYDEQVKAQDPDTYVLAELLADLAYWRLELGQYDRAGLALRDLRALSPNHPKLPGLEARASAGAGQN